MLTVSFHDLSISAQGPFATGLLATLLVIVAAKMIEIRRRNR